jgi:hypothetical protein
MYYHEKKKLEFNRYSYVIKAVNFIKNYVLDPMLFTNFEFHVELLHSSHRFWCTPTANFIDARQ